MSSKIRFDLSIPTSASTFIARCKLVSGRSPQSLVNIGKYFEAIGGGAYWGSCLVAEGAVQATGTITFTGRPTADETLSIANVTLTVKDSGANGTTQFNSAVSNTTTATNLAACINANTTLNNSVTATSSLGVVTITAVIPGKMGNGLQISESMTTTAAAAFSGGVDGTLVTVSNGL